MRLPICGKENEYNAVTCRDGMCMSLDVLDIVLTQYVFGKFINKFIINSIVNLNHSCALRRLNRAIAQEWMLRKSFLRYTS